MGTLRQIAADTQAVETVFSSGLQPIPILAANPNRYGVIFTCSSPGPIQLTLDPTLMAGGVNSGLILSAGEYIQLTVRDSGVLCQLPWFLLPNAGGENVTVWDITFPLEA